VDTSNLDGATSATPPFPSSWPHQTDLLNWSQHIGPAESTLLLLAGIVYLLWGFQIFKILVMLNAACVGAYIGATLGVGKQDTLICGGLLGAALAAGVAWSMMKYAVAMMGGLFGAVLGASLWRVAALDHHFVWAGALIGLAVFGMLSFILFRASVMMYTSLQGSFMMVFGLLGLLTKYHDLAPRLTQNMIGKPMLLTSLVLIPAMVGLIYQQSCATPAGPSKK
jgi:hypothetical protein